MCRHNVKLIDFYEDSNGCFVCTSHNIASAGYPRITRNLQCYRMNRYIWEECFGPIPEGLHVLHSCDNRACINPEHLFLGTNYDNVQDKMSKGRWRV